MFLLQCINQLNRLFVVISSDFVSAQKCLTRIMKLMSALQKRKNCFRFFEHSLWMSMKCIGVFRLLCVPIPTQVVHQVINALVVPSKDTALNRIAFVYGCDLKVRREGQPCEWYGLRTHLKSVVRLEQRVRLNLSSDTSISSARYVWHQKGSPRLHALNCIRSGAHSCPQRKVGFRALQCRETHIETH